LSVRAKFRVESITKVMSGGITIKLISVQDAGIPEELRFALLNPTASLVIFATTKSAEEFFELGAAYFLDFTPAEFKVISA
jgi:hypothetical protein